MLLLLMVDVVAALSFSSSSPDRSDLPDVAATIAVCTGPDCRVDGASDCLRALQRISKTNQRKVTSDDDDDCQQRTVVKVRARNCLGPCGDGPCVVVLDAQGNRKAMMMSDNTDSNGENNNNNSKRRRKQQKKERGSLVPPELFGVDDSTIYQVKTEADVEMVWRLAASTTVGTTSSEKQNEEGEQGLVQTPATIIRSTRRWYDRPNNERKVLQRLMHVMILAGLYEYSESHISLGSLQYGIATTLFILSNFIMKDNLFEQLGSKVRRKMKSLPHEK